MLYQRGQLKLEAKAAMRETSASPWVVTLLLVVLGVYFPNYMVEALPNPALDLIDQFAREPELFANDPEMLLRFLGRMMGPTLFICGITTLLTLFKTVIELGYQSYALKVWRRQETWVADLFDGFLLPGKAIGVAIMTALLVLVWGMAGAMVLGSTMMMLSFVGVLAAMANPVAGHVVLMVLLTVMYLAYLLWILWVASRYVLAPYYILDDPKTRVRDAITKSKYAMGGRVWKYIGLELSFAGWAVLWLLVSAGIKLVAYWALGGLEELVFTEGLAVAVQEVMLATPISLFRDFGLPGALFGALAVLVALPLQIWVTSYRAVAGAGFYNHFKDMGQPRYNTVGGYAYQGGGVPPIPPAPPAPPEPPKADPWDDPTILPPTPPQDPPQDL